MSILSINETYKKHMQEYPDSQLSLHVIRQAIHTGELNSISAGNKRLINWDVFNKWLGYESHYVDKLMDNYENSEGLSDKEKDILIRLLIEKMVIIRINYHISILLIMH